MNYKYFCFNNFRNKLIIECIVKNSGKNIEIFIIYILNYFYRVDLKICNIAIPLVACTKCTCFDEARCKMSPPMFRTTQSCSIIQLVAAGLY